MRMRRGSGCISMCMREKFDPKSKTGSTYLGSEIISREYAYGNAMSRHVDKLGRECLTESSVDRQCEPEKKERFSAPRFANAHEKHNAEHKQCSLGDCAHFLWPNNRSHSRQTVTTTDCLCVMLVPCWLDA
jgi:hypothetical protein